MRKEIRLSGSGGQGIIMIGIVLAESAISQGLEAVQSQSYGPEARGGASKAEVIISSDAINFTKVLKPNVFLALTQDAFDKYSKDITENAIVILDDSIKIENVGKNVKVYSLPILTTAIVELKKPMVANVIALGIMTKLMNELNEELVVESMLNRVPKKTKELNLSAFSMGYEML